MIAPVRIAGGAALLVAVGWVVTAAVGRMYVQPRDRMETGIEEQRARVVRYTDALDRAASLGSSIQSYVDRTLGGDDETVDHRLRSRLNRIAETVGLADATVRAR